MIRPLHTWFLFALGLAIVMPAMGWLTLKALELDRAESLARRQAELEEDVSRALWRMDSLLTPLLAEEAARPDFVYRAVYEAEHSAEKPGSADKSGLAPRELSPLLVDPPEFVLVHFEVHPDGGVTSPQNPTGELNTWAIGNGASIETIDLALDRLAKLAPSLDRQALLDQLPPLPMPVVHRSDQQTIQPQLPESNPPLIANTVDSLNQQLSQQQAAEPNGPAAQALASDGIQTNEPAQQSAQQSAYGNVEIGRSQRSQSRGGNDLFNRDAALQRSAQRAYVEQRNNWKSADPPLRVIEGASRPLWLGHRLVLARRVQVGDETLVQGCWLDWEGLKLRLQAEVADLLPEVELTPLSAAEPIKLSRLLATLPVQLSVRSPTAPPAAWSPIRSSLLIAWSCLLLATVAAALTLQSVIKLSERRAAFVSAVTHELRTPLTTFRMYAEMLAEGMVPDAVQRQRYLTTLKTEADRLSHLVENVLQYARLERGSPGNRREPTTLAALLDHCQSRLAERAAQAEMELLVDMSPADGETTIATDSAAVEQILFNLVDNACKYAAGSPDRRLHLAIAAQPGRVTLSARDHGPGISPAGRRRLFRPFSKSVHEAANSAPGVGLGLALSRRLASDLGGRLELQSPADGGARFVLTLPR
ncbi:MAG: HAMP domain-containing sensor histidine kinase [Pirellulaceae bacterium]